MAELNFVIDQNALDVVKNTKLSANFEEMEIALTEYISPYEKLIVSEDGISEAKTDRARINKVKSNIDSYRKLVKSTYNEPYKKFEEKCKKLTAICDRGLMNIDQQMDEFEKKRKNEKLFLLKDYFNNAVQEMVSPDYVTFEAALHPKWENKGTSLDECKKHMDDIIAKTDTEIKAIRNLHSEWETSLLNEYNKSHDLLSALALHERLTMTAQQEAERRRKQQEEYERKQAELKAKQEEAKQAVREASNAAEWDNVPSDISDIINPLYGADLTEEVQKAILADRGEVEEKEPVYIATIRVYGTIDEISAVRRYMDSHGISHIYDGKEQTDLPIEAIV